MDNEKFVRSVYQIAEDMDIPGFRALFTDDGTFTDESIDVTYRGADVAKPVEIYKTAFPDMHRELYHVYVTGDIVVVQLPFKVPSSARCRRARSSASTATRRDPRSALSLACWAISTPLSSADLPDYESG